MHSSNLPEPHQQRRAGFWRGTGGTARWDESEGCCSHLHLSPLRSAFPLRLNSPTGLTFTLYLFRLVCERVQSHPLHPLLSTLCTVWLPAGHYGCLYGSDSVREMLIRACAIVYKSRTVITSWFIRLPIREHNLSAASPQELLKGRSCCLWYVGERKWSDVAAEYITSPCPVYYFVMKPAQLSEPKTLA